MMSLPQPDKATLTAEIASPTVTGVRQVIGSDPSIGLTPQRLAQLLRAAEEGEAEEYLALAERMEEKDLHYASVLGTRKRAVSQLDVVVEAASEDANDQANAELVRKWIARDALEDELFGVLDAIGKGFSVTELVWETSEKDWQPKRLCLVDPRFFQIDRNDGRTLRLREQGTYTDLPPYKFMVHTHQAKSGLPIRGGLARIAAWAYLFKNYALKDWVAFAEIYGQPMRVGKYPLSATADDRHTLLRAVSQIGSDAAAIIPEGMVIDFVRAEGASANAGIYKELCEFLDKQVSKGVLGQTLTTEVGSDGGARALGDVHNQVRGDIRGSDKKQLGATLTEQLARPLVELNRGPQKAYPRIKLMDPEFHDPEKVLKVAGEAAKLGLRISKQDVLKKMGLKEAAPDEEAIDAPAPPPALVDPAAAPKPGMPKPGILPAGTKPPKPANDDTPAERARKAAAARALAAASPAAEANDAIEGLVESMLDEWQPVMAPIVDPVMAVLAQCTSIEEFRRRLPEAVDAMDTEALQDLLTRGAFAARLTAAAESGE